MPGRWRVFGARWCPFQVYGFELREMMILVVDPWQSGSAGARIAICDPNYSLRGSSVVVSRGRVVGRLTASGVLGVLVAARRVATIIGEIVLLGDAVSRCLDVETGVLLSWSTLGARQGLTLLGIVRMPVAREGFATGLGRLGASGRMDTDRFLGRVT